MPFLRGEVTDNNDPMQRGRVRVKVWGVHKDDDENLPWAEVMGDTADPLHQGKGKKPKKMPIGCTVWVEFEAGDLNCPVVVGVFVGHKAGDDMSAANAGNSDWAMASGGGGGGLGGLLGGTLGALGTEIGGTLGGPLGAQVGGMIGQAMGQKIGDVIDGSGGDGSSGSSGTGTGTGANEGTIESGKAWYVKDGYIHMGKWSRAVKPSGYAEWAPVITKEALAAGVPPTDVVAFANIESAFKPNAVNGSHYGLFQMSQVYFPGTKEPMANIRGALKLYKDNKAFWEKKGDGRPWGPGLAYLLHQQGAAGGTKLATSNALASSIVGANAVKSNAGDLSMTGKQYAQMWMDRLNALSAYYKGATSGGGTGSSTGTGTDNSPVPAKAAAAAAYAVRNYNKKTGEQGYCALYVNNAMSAQGFKASGHGVSVARNLINMNPGKFVSVPYSASYVPKIGDVMSIPANDSTNGPRQREKYPKMDPLPGHVAIFTKSGWVSDFIQGTKYGNTGAANVYYYKGILSGVNPVTIARPLV